MLVKGIGGLLIIFSSSCIGLLLSNKYIQRPKLLQSLRFSLQMLETEIVYGSTPLPYALESVGGRSDSPWKSFFKEVSYNILERKYYAMEAAWKDAVDKHLTNMPLHKDDIILLMGLGKVIGKSDIEDQGKHFKLVYAQLAYHEARAEAERKKNERMYRSLGILVGIAIYIIII